MSINISRKFISIFYGRTGEGLDTSMTDTYWTRTGQCMTVSQAGNKIGIVDNVTGLNSLTELNLRRNRIEFVQASHATSFNPHSTLIQL